ncbi:MAG: MFS transporter [Eubacterium sp.]|nr:MFS transporter [Eubacterium sp.]
MEQNKVNRNLVLVIISIVLGIAYLTPLIRFTFYDQMVAALGISDVELGTIASAYGIFSVICYVPSGILAEKFNTKKLLIISCAAMCLITIWYAFLPGFWALMVIHGLYGIFSIATFWSPYLKAVRNLGDESEQGRLFGISEGIRGVAQTAVAFFCLWVMGFFANEVMGFQAVLFINAVVFAILTLLVIFLVPDFDKGREKPVQAAEKKESMWKMLLESSTWLCIFVIVCGYILWNTVNSYMGTYCTRVLNISPEMSSALSVIRSYIIVFVAGVTGGIIMDRFKFKGTGMFFAFLASGICAAAVLFTSQAVIVCVVVTVVLSYLVNVLKSTYWSILGEAGVPLEKTGMATGIISLIALSPDFFVAPIISRFLAYGESLGDVTIGFNMMIIWMVVWSALGIVSALCLKRRGKKLKGLAQV